MELVYVFHQNSKKVNADLLREEQQTANRRFKFSFKIFLWSWKTEIGDY